jgi:acetoin utilization deacetylase AcuC-like enzyme
LKIICSQKYSVQLAGHVFVPSKFVAAAQLLVERGAITQGDIIEPPSPTREDLLLAHSPGWVDRLLSLSFTQEDEQLAELHITPEVVLAHSLHCGGSIRACEMALEGGLGLHCGGGSHHAFHDHGAGFCLLNDIAVGINKMRALGRIKKAAVVDLDAHQGDGTASIFSWDKDVFTFSMHGRNIFPEVKGKSSLDVELETGVYGEGYMEALSANLPAVLDGHKPELVVYLAGADVYMNDRLGGMRLTKDDISARDAYVAGECKKRSIPLAAVLGGGYAQTPDDTAAIHATTLFRAAEIYS